MEISVNGKSQKIEMAEELTIGQLLSMQKIEGQGMVSVQLNGKIIARDKYKITLLSEDDEIEFLYFMGGGSC